MHNIAIGFILNLATLVLKVFAYRDVASTALFADILNDITDCIGLFLLILGLYLSRKKTNNILYPFGLSRAMYVFGLISMSIFGGVLFTISFTASLTDLRYPPGPLDTATYGIAFVLSALVINGLNFALGLYSYLTARKADPATVGMIVDGSTDFLATFLALIAIVSLNDLIDDIGGIVVSVILLISVVSVSYRYFLILIGRAPPKHELIKILNVVLAIPGIVDINELKALMITEDEYLVILEVEANEDVDVGDLEEMSQKIEQAIKRAVPKVKHVVIEFVPRRKEPPTYRKLRIRDL
uniref:Cation diffusion facilitator family transporter n=1 Tax=Ignisphaera aggregans TaxID=334771 RepID=A0A7C2VB39_9CREN